MSLYGFEGEALKTEVIISSLQPQPLAITGVTSDIDDKIKYKLKTREKGKEYVLKVERRSSAEPYFRGQIVLTTDSTKRPRITLNVLSRLQKEVSVRPESLSFGMIDTAAASFAEAKLSRKVTLQDLRGGGLEIKRIISSSDWIAAEQVKTKNGYTIEITLDKERLPRGEFEETIDVRTNRKKKPISIAVKGTVK